MTDFWDHVPATTDLRSEADVELRLVEPLLRALGYEPAISRGSTLSSFRKAGPGASRHRTTSLSWGPVQDKNTSLLVVEAKKAW